jgi:hypothetical protein
MGRVSTVIIHADPFNQIEEGFKIKHIEEVFGSGTVQK